MAEMYETIGEPPSCKWWSCIIIGKFSNTSSVYCPDVEPDGFCSWAERDE